MRCEIKFCGQNLEEAHSGYAISNCLKVIN